MRRALVFALAAACGCSGGGAEVRSEGATLGGGRYHLTIEDDGRAIVLRRDTEALLTFGADAFQLGLADTLDDRASYDPWAIDQRGEAESGVSFRAPVAFRANGTSIALDYGDGYAATLDVADYGSAGFRFDVDASGPNLALVRVRAQTSGDRHEGFYGTGEQEDTVDQRGTIRAMQVEPDGSLESSYNEAHVPVPFVIGTHGWSLFVASKRVGALDIARKDPSVVEATFATRDRLAVYVAGADQPIDLVSAYYHASGPIRLPAPWALGPWIWRNETTDQAQALADIAMIRSLDLATSGIWLDHPFATAVNTFDFDPKRYADPKALIDRAHAAGLRFAVWSTPYLETAAEPLHSQAVAQGFFPPVSALALNPFGTPIDYTNDAATAFWIGLVKRYTSMGVDGFKLDYGEDVAPALGLVRNEWRFADGSDERTMHHDYSSLYHHAYEEALPDDRFLLCRAAHWSEQSSGCVIWPGDMDATFTKHAEHFTTTEGKDTAGVGGLPATVIQGLTLGASGFPFFGADTGGFRHGPPDAELFTRWFEQTALSTVMQVGGSAPPPWLYDAATIALYRTYARLHMRLFPYEWTLAIRIADDGRPIQRALGLAHPELGVHPSDEYLFGDDLLVAPVLAAGQRTRRVVLPEGTWVDWWDAAPLTPDAAGGAEVPAPLDKLPLLVRDGAIVPMLRPTIDTLAPADDPDVESFTRDAGSLWVRIVPGRPRRFALWDGTSIERVASGAIDVASGGIFTSGFVLELVATAEPVEVDVGDAPLARVTSLDGVAQGWTFSPDAHGTLLVKLGAGASHVVIR